MKKAGTTRGSSWIRRLLQLVVFVLLLLLRGKDPLSPPAAGAWSGDRRIFLRKSVTGASALLFGPNRAVAGSGVVAESSSATIVPLAPPTIQHPFRYSDEWTGTALPLLSLEQALTSASKTVSSSSPQEQWPMGRWPDPMLRRPADPVDIRRQWRGRAAELRRACDILRQTAVANGAVGLAAQQCGVNARIVYVELDDNNNKKKKRNNRNNRRKDFITMINPRIVNRSPETSMRVWREECLVLPPSFRATVLRDDWVDVVYNDISSSGSSSDGAATSSSSLPETTVRLRGETARALQHELDHDRGILVTDHVSLEELESDAMRAIEWPGHGERMARAYARYLVDGA